LRGIVGAELDRNEAAVMTKIAIMDDYHDVALENADWSGLDVTVFRDHTADQARVIERLAPFDIICPMRERTSLSRAVIEALPNLKLIATTGMRNAAIDMAAAQECGVMVTGTAGSATPTPELAMTLMLSLARNIPQEARAMQRGQWQTTMGRSLNGATLGVLGLGKLGQQVAGYARAFNMNLIAWSQNLTAEKAAGHGAKLVDKATLFRESDFISIPLVLSERSRGLVSAADLALMKSDAYIINTSRGPIIDEDALLKVLQDKAIGGAGIDVYGTEPLPANHPIRTLENVVLTPHLGYVTEDTYKIFYGETVECVRAWMAGNPIRVIS
jgi:phosphoglycerate dehydrogenase-like enzyme